MGHGKKPQKEQDMEDYVFSEPLYRDKSTNFEDVPMSEQTDATYTNRTKH